ncbi:MAG: serine/threonine protein kinase [Planctomycetaceae bacterium]|nr:serine/threonine protein kinase [Planctomycetaceae bacterium]
MTEDSSKQFDALALTRVMDGPIGDDSTKAFEIISNQELGPLSAQYQDFQKRSDVSWEVTYRLIKKIGEGGQGVVYLADRVGAHGASFRLALKIFSPDPYQSHEMYDQEMARLARVGMKLAKIQQDHLLDIHNIMMSDGIEMMVMEWVEGYDLSHLMKLETFNRLKKNVAQGTWEYINDVIATKQGNGVRIKPGVAIAILRDCLSGVAALHEKRIVHADLKPSNIMVKLTGNSKIIDFGSAYALDELPSRRTWTPRYAAPELLLGSPYSISSDLASLGYILLEMLTGVTPFRNVKTIKELTQAKLDLPGQLKNQLPKDLQKDEFLVGLIQGLIAPDPKQRFPSAVAADLEKVGAAEIHRHLIKANLASEYEHDLKTWLCALNAMEHQQ